MEKLNQKTPEAADRSLRDGERSINRPNKISREPRANKINEILKKGPEKKNGKDYSDKNADNSL